MRKRRPEVASLDQVRITRDGDAAVIEYRDSSIASTHFHIGPSLGRMSDGEILDEFNALLEAQAQEAVVYEHVALEIPPGRPQVRYFAAGDQWAPRGGVLRCVIDDGGPDGQPIIHVDDQALSLDAFGRLLSSYAGWGMRIAFVPDDALDVPPEIQLGEPEDD
jgi:hypothetical protein